MAHENEYQALGVECPQCGVLPGERCDWPSELKHMWPLAHWARRSMAEDGELGIE